MYGSTSSALKSTHIHNDPVHFFNTYTDYTYSYLFVLCLIGHVWTISQGKKTNLLCCAILDVLFSLWSCCNTVRCWTKTRKNTASRRHGHGNLLWEIKLVGVIPAPLKKKSQLGLWRSQLNGKKHVPNHQPELCFMGIIKRKKQFSGRPHRRNFHAHTSKLRCFEPRWSRCVWKCGASPNF